MASKGDEITLVVSTGQLPEIEREINIPIPQYASGEYQFKFYINGALDSDATQVFDVSFMSSKQITYKIKAREGDEKEISVKVIYTKTGAEGTYVKMMLKIEDGIPILTTPEQHSDVFSTLQSSAGETSEPDDTSSEPDTGNDPDSGNDPGTGDDDPDHPADPNEA